MYICFLRKSGLLVLPGKGKTKQISNQNADPVSDESQTLSYCVSTTGMFMAIMLCFCLRILLAIQSSSGAARRAGTHYLSA